jgi:hypothetical protein
VSSQEQHVETIEKCVGVSDVSADPLKVQRLQAALKEAQDTVRFYDTRAQIVGVGFILAFGIIQSFASAAPKTEGFLLAVQLRILIAWMLVFVPIVMFARVLYPSRTLISSGGKHVFYAPNPGETSIAQFQSAVASCDWFDEISAEIILMSRLRDLKRRRFIAALWAGAVSYGLLFLFAATRGISAAAN